MARPVYQHGPLKDVLAAFLNSRRLWCKAESFQSLPWSVLFSFARSIASRCRVTRAV
jgi:hypothetical protein